MRMTDWKRVGKLRAKGASWEEIADDARVGFHAPVGSDGGRALKALYYHRRSNEGASQDARVGVPGSRRGRAERGMSRTRWAALGAGAAAFSALILILVFLLPASAPQGPPAPGMSSGPGSTGSIAEFTYLAQQHTDACHWPGVNLGDETANVNWISGLPDGTYLQGACCTPMDFPDYSNQTTKLQSYSSVSAIAPDPYSMPSQVAKADVAGENLVLTSDQQTTLSSAMGMTTDNGWCCCQCWAYYAHEGLAKSLIVQDGYTADQVATVINLEDCCGGPGQMNM